MLFGLCVGLFLQQASSYLNMLFHSSIKSNAFTVNSSSVLDHYYHLQRHSTSK